MCIGWLDLVVGGVLLIVSAPTLIILVIVEIVGSRPNDNLATIGILAVITLSASVNIQTPGQAWGRTWR